MEKVTKTEIWIDEVKIGDKIEIGEGNNYEVRKKERSNGVVTLTLRWALAKKISVGNQVILSMPTTYPVTLIK